MAFYRGKLGPERVPDATRQNVRQGHWAQRARPALPRKKKNIFAAQKNEKNGSEPHTRGHDARLMGDVRALFAKFLGTVRGFARSIMLLHECCPFVGNIWAVVSSTKRVVAPFTGQGAGEYSQERSQGVRDGCPALGSGV